jgi:hypothetical protein
MCARYIHLMDSNPALEPVKQPPVFGAKRVKMPERTKIKH